MNQQELTQIAARGISEQQIAKQLEQIKMVFPSFVSKVLQPLVRELCLPTQRR